MIKILSTDQGLSLKGKITELAILRSIQFQCEGYSPEEHGHLIVLEAGDDLRRIPEIGPEGLYDSESFPLLEYVEVFCEAGVRGGHSHRQHSGSENRKNERDIL